MSRAVDLLITYRIMKILVTPFDKQEAFKYGIIDKDGKEFGRVIAEIDFASEEFFNLMKKYI